MTDIEKKIELIRMRISNKYGVPCAVNMYPKRADFFYKSPEGDQIQQLKNDFIDALEILNPEMEEFFKQMSDGQYYYSPSRQVISIWQDPVNAPKWQQSGTTNTKHQTIFPLRNPPDTLVWPLYHKGVSSHISALHICSKHGQYVGDCPQCITENNCLLH